MPGRLPKKEDFPSSMVFDIIPPPGNHPPTNVLILLHGLGDTYTPFTKLAQAIQLPDSVCISLRAPSVLPFDEGRFHWADDLILNEATGNLDMDGGFKAATKSLLDMIRNILMDKCGYIAREVALWGYGQGGCAALACATGLDDDEELCAIISIGGPFPDSVVKPIKGEAKDITTRKLQTPILVCHGNKSSNVTDASIERCRNNFEHVKVVTWAREGDSMPKNREEMLPIMIFLSQRLKSLRGVPAGAVEIGAR
ncbi:alpha/beta-hydrolase [Eremomyces bilateralis CBS 781.70]|uniref:Alpha/beta-hydrolase n=1 Tax=Eremomyces bilateralis CBS 781.70 TaxID=1392243 RepID=A0A6G1GHI3_9PEZI|nr:alpha/beta-hydrolase [Eremomyces bilateralis CBS 781.70]KAF1817557.1 alpha/beta-hydrolase [Eremomyces bilateralis CBS 781.70]